MTQATLSFTGEVSSPAAVGAGVSLSSCAVEGGAALKLTLDAFVDLFACVQAGNCALAGSALYQHLEGLPEALIVEFLALSLEEGSTAIQLLVGTPPVLTGTGGTFPTGFVGGETFTFTYEDFTLQGGTVLRTVAVVFEAGDQTAAQVAARINAAALLAGATQPPASVVTGQIWIEGDVPGGERALNVTVANAVIGFPTTGEVLGVGSPVPIGKVYVASYSGGLPASMLWVKGGPAQLRFVAAGA